MNMKGDNDSAHTTGDQRQQAMATLREQIFGFRTTQMIAVAAKLNIAQHLLDQARDAQSLSMLVNANANSLYRLMRALSSIGVFRENPDKTFANNQASELLLDSATGSLRNIAMLYGEHWLWSAYGDLMYSIQTGKSAFEHVHGKPMYEYLQSDLHASEVFHKAMSAFSDIEAQAIVKAYDFSAKKLAVDVGGGEGALLKTIVKANSNMSGIVFDLLAVDGQNTAESTHSKVTYIQGDFFDEVPMGGDVYILKSVLHNWNDASCTRILKNCRNAMTTASSLLVIERVIPEAGIRSDARAFDINMLVMVGGRERTEDEYRQIFREAGFSLTRLIHTQSSLSIIEASPV